MKLWPVLSGVALALTLVACQSPTPPKGVKPISRFDGERYLGKWYEIARLENRFERGLEQVTATYGKRPDGGLSVLNRGYDPVQRRWKESEGKAYFTGDPTTAALKVSFFGPFYGGYNVIALDDDYRYALVSGPNRDYLWILARTPEIPEPIKQDYLSVARGLDFPVDKLVWVNQRAR
ncbi:outer membrane lipoprotein Blc [Jejubacter calystegiae]|uniref:Outer membrane lipoprotein Blc n=1 Tax=Jejubacter calystegiae TaxID=2579935 RepID=A0A4P8YER6_9ENTR|nr:outer membrane lipoprotein Blc [Jejubacter calystegiae]QCT18303.1 outer membrane lipoprotein Blc [Jejubacter calystegiae]